MKILDKIFNILAIILLLLAINYFMKLVTVSLWLIAVVLIVTGILFFVRIYLRFKR